MSAPFNSEQEGQGISAAGLRELALGFLSERAEGKRGVLPNYGPLIRGRSPLIEFSEISPIRFSPT